MRKRAFGFLLALCAVLCFTPAVAFADGGAPGAADAANAKAAHSHCICGGVAAVGDHTSHADATFTPWNGSDEIVYADNVAYVYLTDNATINGNLKVTGGKTLYLCLNGKEYASNGTNKIVVEDGSHLVLCDCAGGGTIKGATSGWGGMCIYAYTSTVDIFGGKLTGGKVSGGGGGGAITLDDAQCVLNIYGGEITGNNGNVRGGAVYMLGAGTLNMYGGSVHDNTAGLGGGFYANGTFNMYGGHIYNNTATANEQKTGNLVIYNNAIMYAYGGVITGSSDYDVESYGQIQNPDPTKRGTSFYCGIWINGGTNYGFTSYRKLMMTGSFMADSGILYNVDGGRYAEQRVPSGSKVTPPDEPIKDGFVFDGWYWSNRWDSGDNAGKKYDFDTALTGIYLLEAHWLCDEENSEGHSLVWRSDNGEYWQACEKCDYVSARKPIPTFAIDGADKVCRTQDYTISFTLPEGCTYVSCGYEFALIGGDFTAVPNGAGYRGTVNHDGYSADDSSFAVAVYAETADGFVFGERKTVNILDQHVGGKATCSHKAVCEVCGEGYGDLDASNHTALRCVFAKAATADAEGNIEYWICDDCGKYFTDGTAAAEISKADTVLAKLEGPGGNAGAGTSPKTGDGSNVVLWLFAMIASGSVACGIAAKRAAASKRGAHRR